MLTASGHLSVRDRIKDMIITGGFNVYAAEVEVGLLKHPAVAQTAVIGVPDEHWGERVTAIVVPRDGFSDADELLAYAKASLGSVKAPKEVHWMDSLPQRPSARSTRSP